MHGHFVFWFSSHFTWRCDTCARCATGWTMNNVCSDSLNLRYRHRLPVAIPPINSPKPKPLLKFYFNFWHELRMKRTKESTPWLCVWLCTVKHIWHKFNNRFRLIRFILAHTHATQNTELNSVYKFDVSAVLKMMRQCSCCLHHLAAVPYYSLCAFTCIDFVFVVVVGMGW